MNSLVYRVSYRGEACGTQLQTLCASARRASAGNCLICAGTHAAKLQAAGCKEKDFDAFCTGGMSHEEAADTPVLMLFLSGALALGGVAAGRRALLTKWAAMLPPIVVTGELVAAEEDNKATEKE